MTEAAVSLEALWDEMLGYIRSNRPDVCRRWFDDLELTHCDGGVLEVYALNQIQADYLENKCRELFNEAAQIATGALVAVHFVTEKTEKPSPSVNGAQQAMNIAQPVPGNYALPEDEQIPDQILLNPDYVFPNFVTGPCNRLAHAASLAVAEKPGDAYNPLFIHGDSGLGKTHLLQGVCQQILAANPRANICYLSCDSFKNQFMDSVQKGDMERFRHRYRHVDVLVIDDIHDIQQAERSQEEFFHTFNTLYQSRKQIVLSSDSAPTEIPSLEERLISRFNWGLVARIDKPCYETRVAIVRKKAHIRGVNLADDVVCYIASKIENNTRELEGAITGLQARAMLNGGRITLDMAYEQLGDTPVGIGSAPISIQNIIDIITNYFDVKLSDLQSKRRQRSITNPRQICMYLAKQHTGLSLEEIGGYFGGRDHTTVMHAVAKVDERSKGDASFAAQLEQINAQLKNPNERPMM